MNSFHSAIRLPEFKPQLYRLVTMRSGKLLNFAKVYFFICKIGIYWVGQKVSSSLSVTSYITNLLANPNNHAYLLGFGDNKRVKRYTMSLTNCIWYVYAKSLQSCPTLCDPIDGNPPGSSVPGILQARTLEWVAISFSNA